VEAYRAGIIPMIFIIDVVPRSDGVSKRLCFKTVRVIGR
jgi:hypothetical protein